MILKYIENRIQGMSIIPMIILSILLAPPCFCQKNINQKYKSFNKTLEYSIDSIKIPSILLRENMLLTSNDNKLISMSIYSDTIFRVFELPDLRYLGSFGIAGSGPGEFLNPNISSFHAYDNSLIIKDRKVIRRIILPHQGPVTEKTITIIDSWKIPGKISYIDYLRMINDSTAIGFLDNNPGKQCLVYNVKSRQSKWYIDFPTVIKNVPQNLLNNIYQRHVGLNHESGKMVFAYQKIPLLSIYSIRGKLLSNTFINEGPKQEKLRFENKKKAYNAYNLYYESVLSTSDRIYAIYHVKRIERGQLKSIGKRQMHIFDWDGKLISKLILEDWMKCFSISEEGKELYFLNDMSPDHIYLIRLPDDH